MVLIFIFLIIAGFAAGLLASIAGLASLVFLPSPFSNWCPASYRKCDQHDGTHFFRNWRNGFFIKGTSRALEKITNFCGPLTHRECRR